MIAAPFFAVQFADFWLADQLNSLVTALMDFQFLLWFYFTSDWAVNGSGEISKAEVIIRPIVNCLPAWFRFAQCLRRYRDSGIKFIAIINLTTYLLSHYSFFYYNNNDHFIAGDAFPHLVNAGKYSTTFFVVIFATLRSWNASKYYSTFDNPFTYAWLISQFISSCYALTWDLKMDWGLFDKNAGENTFLREEIVYSSSVKIITI
jgi:xenotropic and polytropic retrovirus receptor 1